MTVAFTMTERADQLHHDNASAHYTALIQAFLAKLHTTHVCQPPYSQGLAPCDFWLFPKLKSPLKGRRFVNATVTQYIRSITAPHCRLTSPTVELLQGCTVRSPMTGCLVISRPHDRFSRYTEWLDTFRTVLVVNTVI